MALNYELRREPHHAIGEFSAIIRFANGISASTFAKVVGELNQVAKELDLPAPVNLHSVTIAIGNSNGPKPEPINSTGFQRFASNGEVACALVCDAETITFTLRDYERWDKVLPVLTNQIARLAAIYATQVPAVRSFLVQYLNEFRAKGPHIMLTDELFKGESRWLAPIGRYNEHPWHCHVGEFQNADVNYRHLVNVNFDISPNTFTQGHPPLNYAKLLILAANQYDLPNAGPLIVDVDNIAGEIERNFNTAHSLEKRLLNEIISDEYIALMGEGANEH